MKIPQLTFRRFFFCLLLPGILFGLWGGALLRSHVSTRKTGLQTAELPPQRQIVDYKNGVYWFPWTGGEYDRQLSEFRGEHKELELIGATGEVGSSQMGWVGTIGYHVYFREKKN